MRLLTKQDNNYFELKKIDTFEWNPVFRSDFVKTDVLYKKAPKCDQEALTNYYKSKKQRVAFTRNGKSSLENRMAIDLAEREKINACCAILFGFYQRE